MGDRVTGVAPGFLLLPAREYKWELKNRIEIRLPLEGKISDLVQGTSPPVPGANEFCIYDQEDKTLLLWELIRVLFAQSKYPDLADDECLNVVALELDAEELVVRGEIVRCLD